MLSLFKIAKKGQMMLFQRLLALFDKVISKVFRLQSWGDGFEDRDHQWIYFVDFGSIVGIVGQDDEVHTMMGYWSVRHYYDGRGKLLKRIPVRKDLKEGERRATQEEIALHREKVYRRFSRAGEMINF